MVKLAPENRAGFQSLEEIRQEVEARQGVLSLQMEAVRVAYGAGRLGSQVRENISKALKGCGLGHFPEELPAYQEEWVRLYKLGSPTADLIDAVLQPSSAHDEELRVAVGGEAAAILKQVRELVCQ
jgi:hypothetical protein